MTDKMRHALRVLLLEDDPLDADLIVQTIRQMDPDSVVHCVDDRDAYEHALEAFAPDVVLSDHSVADFDASDALRLVRAHRPECPLLLVAGGYGPTVIECLKGGATDFVHKSELSRLPAAIVAALRQRAGFRSLSERQRQVLGLLAVGASTREIAERLGVSVKTVETHRAHAMKRLGVRDLASLVRYAVRVGIVSPSDE
jgi:DNA-binding NarL/FixJ family response regulator